jgi:phage terminase Nu1 subunit (DNA packaging protein)
MKTETAIKKAGSINQLALIAGVSRQVVQHWKRNGIPDARLEQLRALRPEWFRKAA